MSEEFIDPRSEMMIPPDMVYMNHASVGTNPIKTYQILDNLTRGKAEKGFASIDMDNMMNAWTDTRTNFAKIINGNPEGVVYTSNTASGLGLTADGLFRHFQKGGNIVIPEIEFTTNSFVWQLVARRYGLTLRTVPFQGGELKGWENLIDSETRLVAVSFVQFKNGYVADINHLNKLAHENDAFLSVDGIQGLGAIPFDAISWNVDFLSAGGYKWLLGPWGSGFFYCKPKLLQEFDPILIK